MADVYTLGGAVQIDGTFTDVDGNPIDPTNLTLTVKLPDGTAAPVDPGTFTHPSTGTYAGTYLPATPGTYRFLWLGTGSKPASVDGEFYVRQPLTATYEGWQNPSAATLVEQSNVDFDALGITPAQLERAVAAAQSWVSYVTGRPLDVSLPPDLEPLAEEALRLRVELVAFRSSSENIQNASAEGISSMSVGGVSLTFRDPNAIRGGGGVFGVPALTPSGLLNDDLWALMTDERRDYWVARFSGGGVPAFEVTEPDFSWPGESSHGVRTSDFPWDPFYFEPTGWPGWGWD